MNYFYILASGLMTSNVLFSRYSKSFMFSSAGFTCVAFVAGALSLWAPKFMDCSIRVQGNFEPEDG